MFGWMLAALFAALWGPKGLIKLAGALILVYLVLQTAFGAQIAKFFNQFKTTADSTVNKSMPLPTREIPAGATTHRLVIGA